MEVHLSPDLQAKLARLAAEQGRDIETLAQEAIARFVDYDEWFIREVEKGLASASRGELLSHEEVGTRLEKLITEKQSRR
jgi:predicted transcriptional regulator